MLRTDPGKKLYRVKMSKELGGVGSGEEVSPGPGALPSSLKEHHREKSRHMELVWKLIVGEGSLSVGGGGSRSLKIAAFTPPCLFGLVGSLNSPGPTHPSLPPL